MADNVGYTEGAGTTIAADEIAAVKYQRIKIVQGADGVNDGDVASGNPLPVAGTVAATQSGTWNVTNVSGTVSLPTGAATETTLGSVKTSVELIDDAVVADDAAFTPATTKVLMAGFEFDDSSPDSVNEGDAGAARMSANRNVYTTLRDAAGNERGANINASNQLSVSVDNTVTVGSHAVTNAGTFVTQENGSALTSLQLIDDIVYTDDTSTHATGTSKGALMMAAAVPTDTSVNANDIGAVAMTTDRKLHVSVQDALPAGTAAIGKLAANSGVDIGDVDVTSIAAGTNAIGNIGVIPRTTGGLTTYHLVSAGSTNAAVVKASAGQLFGWYIYNSNAAMRKVTFHNSASSPTAGASVFFTIPIPGSGAANVFTEIGIAFSSGIAITTTTDLADNGTTAVAANDLIINLFYA